jgi:hypothetical protein
MDLREEMKIFCKRLYGLLGLNSENNPYMQMMTSGLEDIFRYTVSLVLRIV